jgi:hypothetical protein
MLLIQQNGNDVEHIMDTAQYVYDYDLEAMICLMIRLLITEKNTKRSRGA